MELLDATDEFAAGAAQFGPAPELEEAKTAMESALSSLNSQDLASGQNEQQTALAALVRARKNLRQKLSMSSGASASQCRQFDRQQAQKLRPPTDRKPQEKREEQVAETRKELEQLAQNQRQWSEEVRSGSVGAEFERDPSQSSSSSSGQSSGQAAQSNQQQTSQSKQQQALQQALELSQELQKSPATSDLTQQQMDLIAEAMERSLQELAAGEDQRAAQTAEDVADRLDDLSQHLAGLNAADFGEQLGHAQRLSQRLAEEQAQVQQQMASSASSGQTGGGNTAAQQRNLAAGAGMLAELLANASAAAIEEDRQIQEALEELRAANPPQEISQLMQEAASEFDSNAFGSAAQAAQIAQEEMEQLAEALRAARKQYAQPRLEELVAAEQEVAELVEAADGEAMSALLQQRLDELEQRLEALARRDARLARGLTQAAESGQGIQASQSGQSSQSAQDGQGAPSASNSGSSGGGQSGDSGGQRHAVSGSSHGYAPTVMGAGLRQVGRTLQSRIQEVIMNSVRMDADEAVPLQYRELVEQYYRELSEDLR